jgi:hypothetical protein
MTDARPGADPDREQTDDLLPSQWERGAPDTPERALVRAMLDSAIRDFRKPEPDHDSARTWFTSEDAGLFSFEWVCAHLGLDPAWVRRRLGVS